MRFVTARGGIITRGASVAPPAGLIFDQVTGAMHGFSNARKLIDSYTGALIRVRRSNDNTESDIGVSGNELDQSALTSFTGANNGFIRTKYCQLTGRNLVQTTNANQPQIVVSGSVVSVSGKPYAQYNGSSTVLETGSATPICDDDSTVFVVFESQSGVSQQNVFQEIRILNNRINIYSDTRASDFLHSAYRANNVDSLFNNFSSQQPTSTKRVLALRRTGNLTEAFDENGLVDDLTSSDVFSANTILELGRINVIGLYFGGKIAELLIWNRALTSGEMTTVTNNIKSFYSIT
jgi:hypothetical protein